MSFNLNTPFSLYSIPVAYFVGLWPAKRRAGLIDQTIGFDNTLPRANVGRLHEYPDVSPEVTERAERLEGAHKNSLEILPLWIGAVLTGNIAGLDDVFLNIASASFLGLRLLYNFIYVNQKSNRQGTLRSITWLAGLSIPITVIVRAANRLRSLKAAA
ncbi:hypothetical protein K474DRAFT_1702908 [Panus rudis PR-1116 ss-1]|nr:hypothetical protein K474DRAFT_1702908 [Panus rudis PR-1116 ss-1]